MSPSTYTRVELFREPSGQPMYQQFTGGKFVGYVTVLPTGYCGDCASKKPVGQSCGCFDNGGQ